MVMAKQGEEARPGEVLATAGEDSAAGYAVAEVPEETEHPTIDLDRVRIVPPSQTPTVRLGDLAKRPGPRAPDQMEMPKPKGPIELPEGRPVTATQVIEVDPDFIVELGRTRAEREEGGAVAGAARVESVWEKWVPPAVKAAEPPVKAEKEAEKAPASTAGGKRPGWGALVMGAVLAGVAVFVVAMVATRGPKGAERAEKEAEKASTAATAVPGAAAGPSATATAGPSATATAGPSATANMTATAGPSTAAVTSAVPAAKKPLRQRAGTNDNPYDAMPVKTAAPLPAVTVPPAVTAAPSAAPAVTAPPTPPVPAPVRSSSLPSQKPEY
jgi:hypothetical protein